MTALQHSERDALRVLVREMLRELVPNRRPQSPATATANPSEAPRIESVSISSDAELQALVRRLLDLSADPAGREALRSGRRGFRLAPSTGAPSTGAPSTGDPSGAATVAGRAKGEVDRIDTGVLSESKVIGLARSGRRVVLGKRVVVTPLARDKARQLGVKLERET